MKTMKKLVLMYQIHCMVSEEEETPRAYPNPRPRQQPENAMGDLCAGANPHGEQTSLRTAIPHGRQSCRLPATPLEIQTIARTIRHRRLALHKHPTRKGGWTKSHHHKAPMYHTEKVKEQTDLPVAATIRGRQHLRRRPWQRGSRCSR